MENHPEIPFRRTPLLSRLAFSLLAVALVLFYRGWQYRRAGAELDDWRVWACVLGGCVLAALGLSGLWSRHAKV